MSGLPATLVAMSDEHEPVAPEPVAPVPAEPSPSEAEARDVLLGEGRGTYINIVSLEPIPDPEGLPPPVADLPHPDPMLLMPAAEVSEPPPEPPTE
jgi:hypothetical protein